LGGLWALEWAWHIVETNLRCAGISGICMPNSSNVALIVSNISAFIRTDGHGKIDSASDPDQEYMYFMGSETLPSACYIISDESSIPANHQRIHDELTEVRHSIFHLCITKFQV